MSDNITADTKALLAMNQKEPSYVTASVLNSFFDILENDDVFGTEGRADPRYNPASDGIDPLDIAPSRRKNEESIKAFDDWAKKNDYTLHDTLLSVVPHSLQHYFT